MQPLLRLPDTRLGSFRLYVPVHDTLVGPNVDTVRIPPDRQHGQIVRGLKARRMGGDCVHNSLHELGRMPVGSRAQQFAQAFKPEQRAVRRLCFGDAVREQHERIPWRHRTFRCITSR